MKWRGKKLIALLAVTSLCFSTPFSAVAAVTEQVSVMGNADAETENDVPAEMSGIQTETEDVRAEMTDEAQTETKDEGYAETESEEQTGTHDEEYIETESEEQTETQDESNSETMSEVLKNELGLTEEDQIKEASGEWIEVDSKSDLVKYSGTWEVETGSNHIGGDSKQSNTPGAAAEITFIGTGIRWIGQKDTNYGEARIVLDGEEIDRQNTAGTAVMVEDLYTLVGIPFGEHTLRIEAVGPKVQYQNYIEVDAFEYTADISEVIADSLKADPDSISLKVGKSTELDVDVLRGSAHVYKQEVKVASSDEQIAKAEGLNILGIGIGSAVLTVISKELTMEIPVNVMGKSALRMTVDNENPLIIHHMARELNPSEVTPGPIQGGHDIVSFWNQLPENQKPYSAIVLHPGDHLNADFPGHMEFLEEQTRLAEENHIPFFVMIGNSFTSNFLSNAKVTEYYQNFKYFMGTAYSELHSAGNRTKLSNEIADKIELAAQYGGYVWVADMNDVNDSVEAIINNERFYNTAKENKENLILMSKTTSAWSTSVSYNSFESVTYGAWLSDICDNYGSLIDSWMWFIEGYWKLYENPDGSIGSHGPEECRGAFAFPELLYPMRMIQESMSGATVYSFEHPFNSTGIRNQIGPVYNHAISKAVDYMLNEKIPDKAEMLAKTKIVYDSSDGSLNNFAGAMGWNLVGTLYGDGGTRGGEKTFMTQTTGRYGILPSIIPRASQDFRNKNKDIMALTKTDIQNSYNSSEKLLALFDETYPQTYTGTGFAYKLDNIWFTYNSKWQQEMRQEVTLPTNDSKTNIRMEYDNYTYLLLKEENNQYKVNLNNFLVDKDDIWEGYIAAGSGETQHWDSDHNALWPEYLLNTYMPDGARRDEKFRNTVITLTNQEAEPVIEITDGMYDSGNNHNQYSKPEVTYNPSTKEAKISIDSNGWVNFVIHKGIKVDKQQLLTKLKEAKGINAALYTKDSYKVLADAIQSAQAIVDNEKVNQQEVDAWTGALAKAIAGLKKLPTQAELDALAAGPVINKINSIKKVTLNSKTLINEVRNAYNRLTALQKNLVKNYTVLTTAENRLKELTFQSVKLSLKASPYQAKYIKLSWKKAADANGYVVQIKKNRKWTTLKTMKGNTSFSYIYKKTTAGSKYEFAVKAYKVINNKIVYSQSKKITQKAVPAVPSSVKGKVSKGYVKITWNKVSGASGYVVMKKTGSTWKKAADLKSNQLYLKDKDVKRAKKYSYKVKAYIKSGKKNIAGSYSAIISVKAK